MLAVLKKSIGLWKKDGEKSRPEINRIKQRRDELRKQTIKMSTCRVCEEVYTSTIFKHSDYNRFNM